MTRTHDSARGVDGAAFDIREFARTAHGSHRDQLDLDAYAVDPLPADTVAVVALLSRLERGAIGYLRSVLVTPTHKDARVTAFLVTWAYEKYWIADALELIATVHPDVPAPQGSIRWSRRVRRTLAERTEPIRESVVANLIGDDVIAVHMTAGAIDEWLAQTAYGRLAETSGNAELTATLRRVLDVKQRHNAYFTAEARERLAGSAGAVKLARRRLPRLNWPLGAADEPPVLLTRLLGDVVPASDLAGLDARVDALPGLSGLQLVAGSAARTWKEAR